MPFDEQIASVAVKMGRAKKIMAELQEKVSEIEALATRLFEIERGFFYDELNYFVRVKSRLVIPLDVAAITGEVFHGIRSSLDHLVAALVRDNGGMVNKHHQFPICFTEKEFQRFVASGKLHGLTDEAVAQISLNQPFRSVEPKNHRLAVIATFNNADKHRDLLKIDVMASLPEHLVIGGSGGAIVNVSQPDYVVIKHEFVDLFHITLESPAPDFNVACLPEAELGIGDTGTFGHIHLMDAVEQCYADIHQAIAAFRPFFKDS